MSGRVSSVAILRMEIIVVCFFCARETAAQSQVTIQEGVHQAGINMAAAFNKGDAKALAALYVASGLCPKSRSQVKERFAGDGMRGWQVIVLIH